MNEMTSLSLQPVDLSSGAIWSCQLQPMAFSGCGCEGPVFEATLRCHDRSDESVALKFELEKAFRGTGGTPGWTAAPPAAQLARRGRVRLNALEQAYGELFRRIKAARQGGWPTSDVLAATPHAALRPVAAPALGTLMQRLMPPRTVCCGYTVQPWPGVKSSNGAGEVVVRGLVMPLLRGVPLHRAPRADRLPEAPRSLT